MIKIDAQHLLNNMRDSRWTLTYVIDTKDDDDFDLNKDIKVERHFETLEGALDSINPNVNYSEIHIMPPRNK